MKKIILGFLLGIVCLVLFLYLGGPKYLKSFGAKTEEAGDKLQRFERPVQESAKTVKKAADKAYDKTKETVKGYMK